jgi:hypothetical protein
MRLDDPPRLTEERDALDDCVANEQFERWLDQRRAEIVDEVVAARTTDVLTAQRAAALVEMRTAGDDLRRFKAASKREAALAAQIRRLRKAAAPVAAGIAVSLFLSGCSLTPTQKTWAGFAAGVLIVGAIAAHDSSKPVAASLTDPTLPCRPQPDGSCR